MPADNLAMQGRSSAGKALTNRQTYSIRYNKSEKT